MKRWLALLLALVCLVGCLGACSSKKSTSHGGIPIFVPSTRPGASDVGPEEPEEPDTPPEEEPAPSQAPSTPTPAPAPEPSEEPSEEPKGTFAMMAGDYSLTSGVGAWSSDLTLYPDGSFTGSYHDSDDGVTGDDYPRGTFYHCDFTGAFSQPVQIDAYTWSTTLVAIQTKEDPGQTTYEDGIRYISTGPVGLEKAKTIILYTPGAPADDLPDGFMSWAEPFGLFDADRRFTGYGIYNVDEELAFLK